MRKKFTTTLLSAVLFVFVGITSDAYAADNQAMPASIDPVLIQSDGLVRKQARSHDIYIVQLKGDPVINYEGDIKGYKATKPGKGKKLNPNSAHVKKYAAYLEAQQNDTIQSVGGDKVYSYRYGVNGFAARMTHADAQVLKLRSDVANVWKDELRQLQTDSSPTYIGLTEGGEAWSKGLVGEDVVVGIIDSGIWPEHPSFADVPTPKKGNKGPAIPYDAPPAGWSGADCDFGNQGYNPLDNDFDCNNKLIGASYYANGFLAASDLLPSEYLSARDNDGHGSHVASTAGGNFGVAASIGGDPLGNVSGVAPRARIATYKVCWNGSFPPPGFLNGCFSSDSMAAIDQAVVDGVDVINFSIGGSSTRFSGPDDISFLFAADAGVLVATSNGNSGPEAQTTGTPAGVPWITAVGANQDDGVFAQSVGISTDAPSVSGIYVGIEAAISVPLTDSGAVTGDLVPVDDGTGVTGIEGCFPLVNGADVAGNIALISRGSCAFATKFLNAQAEGATAVIVYNNNGDPIIMGGDPTGITIPGVMVGQTDGELFEATITGGDTIVATLDPNNSVVRDNRVATFSSRGPNGGMPDVIKPDISAPGVSILAAQTPTPNDGQLPGQLFQIISGTSMSSPHVAGAFALLKQAHPDWSAAQARSALMTTARQDLKKTFGDDAATPFDIGAGEILPSEAPDPGLSYDAGLLDYVAALCGEPAQAGIVDPGFCSFVESLGLSLDPSDLNLPSIGVAELVGSQTVTRTVTSVANNNGNKSFTVSVDAPPGIDVSVNPSTIKLKNGESASFDVTMTANNQAVPDEWTFGSLTWTHGGEYSVRSPIAVRPVALAAPGTVGGAGTDGSLSYDVQFGYSGDFVASVSGLVEGDTAPGAVPDGGADLHFFFVPPGTTLARFSLFDDEIGAQNDLDLQIQGPDTAGFPLVCFSGTPTSEEQCDLVNPAPGFYAAFVIDFASDPDPTPYTLWNFNPGPDAGNTTLTAPASAVVGTSGQIDLSWFGLTPGTRVLGTVNYSDGVDPLNAQTIVEIDTR